MPGWVPEWHRERGFVGEGSGLKMKLARQGRDLRGGNNLVRTLSRLGRVAGLAVLLLLVGVPAGGSQSEGTSGAVPVQAGSADTKAAAAETKAAPAADGQAPDGGKKAGEEAAKGKGAQSTEAKTPMAKAQASMPKPVPNLNIEVRRDLILANLNEVIGFYRASLTSIQKAGEPNDVVYFDQSVELATQAAMYAFESAEAEALLLQAKGAGESGGGEQQRLQASKSNVERQLAGLKASAEALDKQMDTAKVAELPGLREQRKNIEAAISLSTSMDAALQKITGTSDLQGGSGLSADIARLQHSVPELNSKTKLAAPQLTTLDSARSEGVSSQGEVLFQLLGTKRELQSLQEQNADAQQAAAAVRAPISALLRSLVGEGQKLSDAAVVAAAVPPAAAKKSKAVKSSAGKTAKASRAPAAAAGTSPTTPAAAAADVTPVAPATDTLASITTQFKALSSAAVPLSQEVIVLEQSKANLTAWQAAVAQEYTQILHALLARVVVIAIALTIIFFAGEVWRRGTNKYIHDSRRRRQLLVVRRVTIGFLSAIVVLFGFVTQFNSLATFAGFITAGIAVGLQTILLSVAAYFFIVGRYGVKVGDRITISSVTGDVIDVGLVRFYMMELAGAGVELNPTGRVAVFSNAVLFQAGTPLYKQIPGTQFAWHELIVKLAPTTDYEKVTAAIMQEVDAVYQKYRASIERQHRDVESWMQAPIPAPVVDSRLQFNAGVLQLWARFPVQISMAAEADEQLTKALLKMMTEGGEFKDAFAGPPTIQASVKG